jgi:hypothetical protein
MAGDSWRWRWLVMPEPAISMTCQGKTGQTGRLGEQPCSIRVPDLRRPDITAINHNLSMAMPL